MLNYRDPFAARWLGEDDPSVSEPTPAYLPPPPPQPTFSAPFQDEQAASSQPAPLPAAPVPAASPQPAPAAVPPPMADPTINDPSYTGTPYQPPAVDPVQNALRLLNPEQHDSRDADSGPRESGPAPWTPLSPNPEPVTPPKPQYTYQIADGRMAPPNQTGNWEPVTNLTQPSAPPSDDPGRWLADDSQSTPPARVAGMAMDEDNPEPPRSPYAPGQAESMQPRADRFETRPGYGQVVSTPGEPDYVDSSPRTVTEAVTRTIRDASLPGGLLEPTGGATRQISRMARIQRVAQQATGKPLLTAIDDPQWREANPELADEYDQLQMEFGLNIATNMDAPKFQRGVKDTVEVLQERIEKVRRLFQDATARGDQALASDANDVLAQLTGDLADARNARLDLEPRIRSDVGQRAEELPITEARAERTLTQDAQTGFSGQPARPDELSGPVSIPTDMQGRMNVTPGVGRSASLMTDVGNSAGGGVMGAATGYALPADSEEERRQNALKGAAIGMVGAPVAGRLASRTDGTLATFGFSPNRENPQRAVAMGADPSKRYEFRYRVVDLGDLVPSHRANGAPNPAFPQELQPRDRGRVASMRQVDQMAQSLSPDALLFDAGRLDSGPMIVGPDMIVESGNGRTLALQRAAQQHPEQYQRYVESLSQNLGEYGLDERALTGVRNPVLVRERLSDVDRAAFAAEANNAGLLRMSAFEQAAQDAGNLSDDLVTSLTVGDDDTIAAALRRTDNRPQIRSWVNTLPANEQAGVIDAAGNLSAQGYDRLTNAMLMRTYGEDAGARLVRAFVESADPTVRNVQTALMASLPDMARSEAMIRAGTRDAELSLAGDVATAVDMLARLRREGVKVSDYLSQSAMFERELTPIQEQILGFLDANTRRPSAIKQGLREYAQRVADSADPNQIGMFGEELARPSRSEVWNSAIRDAGANPPTAGPLFEADQAAGRAAADGAGLARPDAAPAPAPSVAPTPPQPPRRQARPAVAPPASRERADIIPRGGPEGTLAVEGAPQRLQRPTPRPDGPVAPVGGPEGTLRAPGTPQPLVRPTAEAPMAAPSGGPDGTLASPPTYSPETLRTFQERIREPAKAEAAAREYQRLIEEDASPETIASFLRNAQDSRWWDRFDTLRYASMLSDPVTHGQNALGNIQMGAVNVLERPLTALLDTGRARITGGAREAFLPESSAQVLGMAASAGQGLRDAAFIMAHGLRPEDLAKLDRPTRGFATNIRGIAPRGSARAAAVDTAMEAPLRLLSAADALFRGTFQGGHLAAEATRAAMKMNDGKPATVAAVKRMMDDPDVARRASERAAQTVLQEDRTVTRAINAMRAQLPAPAQAILSVAVPYIKTPYNIVAQGVGMTPAGVISLIGDIKAGKPMADRERRVARMMIGAGVMAWASYENLQGLNTGGYPESEAERSTLPPGWRPYSRKIEVGGETYYVPLALMGPLGIPAMFSVLTTEQYKKGQEFSPEMAAKVAAGVGQLAEDQTFLRSIADLSSAMSKGGNTAMNYIERQTSQFSPHVIGGGGIGRRVQAILGEPSRDPDGVVQAWLATLPYGDSLADAAGVDPAPIRRDVLGRPAVTNPDGLAALVPIRSSRENDAPVIAAFRAGGEGLPREAPDRLTDPRTHAAYSLSPAQQSRWQAEFGAELQQRWERAGSPMDSKRLQSVENDARAAVNERLLRDVRGGPVAPARR